MKKISHLDIIQSSPSLDAINQNKRNPVSVLLDNIRSLYNVGSIFRTSDAAGVEKLYLCGITGAPPRAEIHKAALGAEKSVPWEKVQNPVDVVSRLKKAGYKIVVLEHTDSGAMYNQVQFEAPLCLVVGHEITGITDEVVRMADIAIEIPMAGFKQSLNVSVAYGIAIFEIMKHLKAQTE